jgi:putative addiction module killer protein
MTQDVFDIRESDEVMAWLNALKDLRAQGYLRLRIRRARQGNLGRVESVGGGVFEMKHNAGPGYRLYYSQLAKDTYQLLCGGDKSTQAEDVKYAKALKAVKEREHERENPR